MACTITSLFLFSILGIIGVGLAFRPGAKRSPPVQRDQAKAPTSGRSAIAEPFSKISA